MMRYIRTESPSGAEKYHGAIAQGYDAKRDHDPKWKIEQAIIEDMLNYQPSGSWVLDIPCGTGRFFKAYHDLGFVVRGMDRSADMLQQAAYKVVDPQKVKLQVGDVRSIGLYDRSVDVAVMCRLTRWLSPSDCVLALKELQRVARHQIIFTARVRNHPHARSYDLFQSALDGWKIYRDEAGADLDYRIIELRPC